MSKPQYWKNDKERPRQWFPVLGLGPRGVELLLEGHSKSNVSGFNIYLCHLYLLCTYCTYYVSSLCVLPSKLHG